MVREIRPNDYDGLMKLYTHLHDREPPKALADLDEDGRALWTRILGDRDYHIIVAEEDGMIVSSCTCVVIPNLTRGHRPYAFVENVVTHADYHKRGLASACLARAEQVAREAGCYKMMLMTGAKDAGTLHFYEQAGFDRHEKTAFIMRLK